MRENYSNELKSRTELDVLLRGGLDDIKREMALKANQEELTRLATQIHTKYAKVGITAEELGLPAVTNAKSSGQSGKDDIELMFADDTDDLALPPRTAGTSDGRPSSSHSIKLRRIRGMIKQAQSHVATKLAQDMKLSTPVERLKYLQSLLNQEKVVKLLYERTFPFQTYNYSSNNNNSSPSNQAQEYNSNQPAVDNNNGFFSDYNNTTTVSSKQKGVLIQETDTADFERLQLGEVPVTAAMGDEDRARHHQNRPFTDSL